jgi:hypothetical protein
VRGAELRRLAGDAVVATVAVARGRAEHRLEARAGDALSLALRAGAPLRAATGLLAAAGFDPTDEAQMRERDARHVRALTERIAARTEAPPRPPFPPPAPLDTARQRRVEAALERLRGELAGRSAVLLHRSGALVAWRGAFDADPALLRDYALALASADADLVDLLMCRLFARRSGAGVVFADFGDGWRLEVALTEERADGHERLMGTAAELEPLLAGRAVG